MNEIEPSGAGRRGIRAGGSAAFGRAGLRGLVLVLLVAAAAGAPAGARAADEAKSSTAPKTWHATVFFSNGASYRIIHYWSDGAKMRAETLISGHPVATIIRGDRYIALDRLTGKALDIERAPAAILADQGRPRPFGIELDELKKAGGERIEDTTMSGVPVEVWRLTDDTSRRTVWVSKKPPHVPIRLLELELRPRDAGRVLRAPERDPGRSLRLRRVRREVREGTDRRSPDPLSRSAPRRAAVARQCLTQVMFASAIGGLCTASRATFRAT
jgi:hypothetical protein